jgi:chromosomal replication initiator protein
VRIEKRGNKQVQELSGIWQAVLGEIELLISRGSFMTWFKNTHLLKHDGDNAVIGVPNIFIKQQLERRHTDQILELLKKNGLNLRSISFKIHSGPVKSRSSDDAVILNLPEETTQSERRNTLSHSYRQGINEKYTFENFIVGSGNELAYAACQAIASKPGSKYNPLFLYGGVGIGKTHLIQAVGNAIAARRKDARVVYVSTEQFVQEFLDAIRYKKNTDFASYYRSADVLIVDDIQFIAGKEKTQEEFFHTFNALHQANKQIILSSDKPPRDIPTLEDRLRSRFTWGMAIDMQNPDFETRCAIIQTKAEQAGAELPQDVVEYLARLIQTNIRELEGALNQLLAFCEMRGLKPDLVIASSLLGNSKNRPKHISARSLVEKTARHFQIGLDEMVGPKRDKEIVYPRQVAMYLLRSELHLSFPKIARELGRKDHTTAIHSVEKIEADMNIDPHTRQHIIEIKEKLYA